MFTNGSLVPMVNKKLTVTHVPLGLGIHPVPTGRLSFVIGGLSRAKLCNYLEPKGGPHGWSTLPGMAAINQSMGSDVPLYKAGIRSSHNAAVVRQFVVVFGQQAF